MKRIYGLEYQRTPVGSLTVCNFCEMAFPDEGSFRLVVQKWQASLGLESLVQITGSGNLLITESIPTTAVYDFEEKLSIVESIRVRNQVNLRDKGDLERCWDFLAERVWDGCWPFHLARCSRICLRYLCVVEILGRYSEWCRGA